MTQFGQDTFSRQAEPAIIIINRHLTDGTVNKAAEALTGTRPEDLMKAAKRSTSLRQAIPVVLGQSRRVRASIEIAGKGVFWGTVSRIDRLHVRLTLDTGEPSGQPEGTAADRPLRQHRGGPYKSDLSILNQLLGDAAGSEAELTDLVNAAPPDLRAGLQALLDRVWSYEARFDFVIASEDGPALPRRARLDIGDMLDRLAEARFGPYGAIERPGRLPDMVGNPLLTRRLLRQSLHYLLPEPGHSDASLGVIQRRSGNRIALVIANREPQEFTGAGAMRQAQAAAVVPILAERQDWQAETGIRADGTLFVEVTGPAA